MSEFAAEQRALAARCWQFVGLRDELAEPDAWIRRTLFGTPVFVQNFDGELRGFHNVCAHRGFPLRCEDVGRGPVTCGFHGWSYNRAGVPTGVPRNAELFGLSREQREALALPAIRVETIGRFVFAARGAVPSLEAYLGAYGDVYRAVDRELGALLLHDSSALAANWKLHVEISLDDYHPPSIHATTFGAADQAAHRFVYRRDGLHSSYLRRRDPDWSFAGFWADLKTGRFDRSGYKIFNLFPNCLLTTMPEVCNAATVTPIGPARSVVDNYVLAWDGAVTEEASRAIGAYFDPVFREDRAACERWQTSAPRTGALGRLEERVRWFHEVYGEVVGQPLAPLDEAR